MWLGEGHFSNRSIFHLPSESHEGGRDRATKDLPVMIFATDAVKICHSGGGETNILVQLDGIPAQLFATIQLFDECLRDWGGDAPHTFPEWMRQEMAEKLIRFLNVHQLTPPVKEILFHFVAKILRTNGMQMVSSSDMENSLKIFADELKNLFEGEKSNLGIQLFSTYLQSLFELTSACRQGLMLQNLFCCDWLLLRWCIEALLL